MIFKDLWEFIKQEKKWWLVPLILVIVVVGLFIVVAGSSPLAPFTYTLF